MRSRAQAQATQRDRAIRAIGELGRAIDPDLLKMLWGIVSEAQNGPPGGSGDGSIVEDEWKLMQRIASSLEAASAAARYFKNR